MISKNKIKLIKSLTQKKYRVIERLFLAEGNKLTEEILKSDLLIRTLICTDEFYKRAVKITSIPQETIIATQDEIRKCSFLKTPQQTMVICEIPDYPFLFKNIRNSLTLCLDGIQNPGNFGTILRIADWFGIHTICASENTADVYNPKVVQASMGAFLRVKVFYTSLNEIITQANSENIPTYGTFLSGLNIYGEKLAENGLIVMGNEGQGISAELEHLIKYKIHIPAFYSIEGKVSESLNVSMATSIICSEFRRGKLMNYSK